MTVSRPEGHPTPPIDVIECPNCDGRGGHEEIDHERECYEVGECRCGGVLVQVPCRTCAGIGRVRLVPATEAPAEEEPF